MVLAFTALPRTRTTADSGYGFTALWLSLTGLGFGFAVVPAMDGPLGALPADRAGSGSRLPSPAAHTAREPVVAAHGVAVHTHAPHLAASPHTALTLGMSLVLVCGIASLAAALLAAPLLPDTPVVRRAGAPEEASAHGRSCRRCRTMTGMTAARPTSPVPSPDRARPEGPRLGLRERKKIKTREAIRGATYALIEQQGYDATTIDQIADRAEVSPSTVFRYFPTKEDIVLTDEFDAVMLEEIRRRPAEEPWGDTIRYVLRRAVQVGMAADPAVSRLRTRLMVQVPAVRSRMMESMSVTGHMLCRAVAERTGRDPGDLEVRVYAMSLIGGLIETTMYWAEHGHQEDLRDLIDRSLDVLEHGLPGAENH